MKITVIAVGKLKERYWEAAVSEYVKRMNAFAKLSIIDVSEEKAPDKLSSEVEKIIKHKEGGRILEKICERDFVVALAVDGVRLSSESLAQFLQAKMVCGVSCVVFVIGGSLGLSPQVLSRADCKLSFSDMTFPHQLMRVLLLEQVYRSFKIIRGEPYHK